MTLFGEQPREAGRGAQLVRFSSYLPRQFYRLAKISLGEFAASFTPRSHLELQFTVQPECLRAVEQLIGIALQRTLYCDESLIDRTTQCLHLRKQLHVPAPIEEEFLGIRLRQPLLNLLRPTLNLS